MGIGKRAHSHRPAADEIVRVTANDGDVVRSVPTETSRDVRRLARATGVKERHGAFRCFQGGLRLLFRFSLGPRSRSCQGFKINKLHRECIRSTIEQLSRVKSLGEGGARKTIHSEGKSPYTVRSMPCEVVSDL